MGLVASRATAGWRPESEFEVMSESKSGATLAAITNFGCAGPGRKRPIQEATSQPTETKPKRTVAQTAYNNVRIAFIGTAGIGGYHLENAADLGLGCPCYCDVDSRNFGQAAELYPHARQYQDYRQMFDKEHKNIDGVMIGIPDHHHYVATMIAMQLGKHVYTQKPLTHTPWEARQLVAAARKYKVATQMGNQGHAKEGWRLVYEWIHSGALGQIREVHTWTDRPIWPQGIERPEGEDVVPASLNWDVWLGPAPVRPFKKGVYHQFNWRGWWDFGCGALGDMACHTMDGIFWALDPGYPTVIEPIALTAVNNETFPKASMIKWEFPAKGERAAFSAYWYDGGLMPTTPPELEYGRKLITTGNLFLGTKASLLVGGDYGDSPRIIPEAKMQEAVAGEKPIDFPKSNFDYAGPFTETVLLGNIALRVGRRLEWDGPNMRFTNIPEANAYLTKEYREGWKV
jgi:predicted dehydrogenase